MEKKWVKYAGSYVMSVPGGWLFTGIKDDAPLAFVPDPRGPRESDFQAAIELDNLISPTP